MRDFATSDAEEKPHWGSRSIPVCSLEACPHYIHAERETEHGECGVDMQYNPYVCIPAVTRLTAAVYDSATLHLEHGQEFRVAGMRDLGKEAVFMGFKLIRAIGMEKLNAAEAD